MINLTQFTLTDQERYLLAKIFYVCSTMMASIDGHKIDEDDMKNMRDVYEKCKEFDELLTKLNLDIIYKHGIK